MLLTSIQDSSKHPRTPESEKPSKHGAFLIHLEVWSIHSSNLRLYSQVITLFWKQRDYEVSRALCMVMAHGYSSALPVLSALMRFLWGFLSCLFLPFLFSSGITGVEWRAKIIFPDFKRTFPVMWTVAETRD